MRRIWIVLGVTLAGVGLWWLLQDPKVDVGPAETTADRTEGQRRPELRGVPAAAGEMNDAAVVSGPAVIRGSVEDAAGTLLAGIPVQLALFVERSFLQDAAGRWLENEATGQPEPYAVVGATLSAADGHFAFRGLAQGNALYRVSTQAEPPWTPAFEHVYAIEGTRFVRLVLSRGDPLRVRVVDERGHGVAAYVTCWREREGVGWHPAGFEQRQTDATGRLTAHLPDGAYRCMVRVPGVGSRTGVLVEAPQSREVVISLAVPGGASVQGTVTDTLGKAIAGARVLVISGSEFRSSLSRLATTAADGSYRIDQLMPGDQARLAASAKHFLTLDTQPLSEDLTTGRVVTADITMLRGGVLEGIVRGPNGRGVAGAAVRARSAVAPEGLVSSDRAMTAEDGRYRMTAVPPGAGHVRVSAPGYYQADTKQGWYVIEDELQRKVVDVVLARGIPVRGRVTDQAGRPVAGADVEVRGTAAQGWWPNVRTERVVQSDAEGRFAYPGLPPSEYWHLQAQTGESRSQIVTVHTATNEVQPGPVQLVLARGAVVRGRVMRGDDSVRDLLRVQARTSGGASKTVSLQTDGTFELIGLQSGVHDVFVVDWNLDRVSDTRSLTLTAGAVHNGLELTMRPLAQIAGVVVDERGEPMPELSLRLDISMPGMGGSIAAQTNLRGRFVFSTVPDLGYAFPIQIGKIRHPGTFKPGDLDVRLVYKAPQRVRLEGTVFLPDGTPAKRGRVQLWEITADGSRNGTTVPIVEGAFGQSIKRETKASTFEADVREVFDAFGRPVSIQPAKIEGVDPGVAVEFRLEAGLAIQGIVVGSDGVGIAGARVTIKPQDTGLAFHHKTMRTRADGSFAFGALAPGKIAVGVDRTPPPWLAPRPLNVQAGDKEVRITLIEGGVVRGRVLDEQGAPVRGARVTWRSQTGHTANARCDDAGRFRLAPIEPDQPGSVSAYAAQPSSRALLPATVEDLRAGATGIELRLATGAYLEGEVVGPDGEAIANLWISLSTTATGQPGSHTRVQGGTHFRIGPVIPGHYHIHVQAGGAYVAPQPLAVTAPAKDIHLVVPKGLTVSGTLTGAAGLARYSVGLTRMTPDGPRTLSGNVMASGQFLLTVRGDEPGTLYFRASSAGDLYGLVEGVRPSPTPLRVSLQKGLTIAGRFADYTPADEGHVWVQGPSGLSIPAVVAKDGTFLARALPPGSYAIHAIRARRKIETLPDVRAGTHGHVLR